MNFGKTPTDFKSWTFMPPFKVVFPVVDNLTRIVKYMRHSTKLCILVSPWFFSDSSNLSLKMFNGFSKVNRILLKF